MAAASGSQALGLGWTVVSVGAARLLIADWAQRWQRRYLDDDAVLIRLLVGSGPGQGRAWGCDLSDQYVRINADYTT